MRDVEELDKMESSNWRSLSEEGTVGFCVRWSFSGIFVALRAYRCSTESII